MATTFFGAHSFGGDAGYVDRLARSLLARGHVVDVVYSVDAFELTRGDHEVRPYQPPEGLNVIGFQHRLGNLGALWTHQTSRPGPMASRLIELFERERYDVIHLHNISLMGGLGVIPLVREHSEAALLMTAHDHWLTCPLSLLWKLDREVCRQPECIRCTIAAHRPPQLWRRTGLRERSLEMLDGLLVSTEHARLAHRERGVVRPIEVLPYFLPTELLDQADQAKETSSRQGVDRRPYFALAGRLIKEKGFERVIQQMKHFPEADLLIAGDGPLRNSLRDAARELDNVRLLGLLDYQELLELYGGATALIVPSEFYETFGYVVLEAFSVGTPVIVRRRGPLPEHVEKSKGGLIFETDQGLVRCMRQMLDDLDGNRELGHNARAAVHRFWNEDLHLRRYERIIDEAVGGEKVEP